MTALATVAPTTGMFMSRPKNAAMRFIRIEETGPMNRKVALPPTTRVNMGTRKSLTVAGKFLFAHLNRSELNHTAMITGTKVEV